MEHSPFSESGRVPPPTDAKNQPLDSSARNPLIHIAMKRGLCGLRPPLKSELGARNCPERVKTGTFPRRICRGEVRRNPHEPAQVRGNPKKMSNCIHSWTLLLVAEREYEHSFGRMRIRAERCGFLRINTGSCLSLHRLYGRKSEHSPATTW